MSRVQSPGPGDFSPPLLRITERPPAPLAGWVLRAIVALLAAALLWATFGELDIVAVAQGKLVPRTYLKIVQPAEQGVVRELLVREGERVAQGQVLIRMDAVMTQADVRAIRAEYDTKRLSLRRIDAQLAADQEGRGALPALSRVRGDPPEIFAQVEAQYRANVRAYENALAQERSALAKARHDLAGARETRDKLERTLPHYREQEEAFGKLARDGFAGRIMATDKTRERIEREQDLRTQEFVIASNTALIEQSERRIDQIGADYRRQLRTERVETAAQAERARQELAKHAHRESLLELRAPQAGFVKDLATHTVGTVTAPGTILMTLVPEGDALVAEVWVTGEDIGFVREGQEAKVKLAAFPFQKYGLVEGRVSLVNVDATETPSAGGRSDAQSGRDRPAAPLAYRALLELAAQDIAIDGRRYALAAGMQAAGEIHLGTRTLLEYLLSPVQRAYHEAARER